MPQKETKHRRGSTFIPILLILLGLIFLAHNLELIPGQGWQLLVKLWPVLLIVAGLDELIRRQGLAWPILLIGAGTVLLLNHFGSRSMFSWTRLVQLWPLILIAIGIDFLYRSRTWWATVISILLVLMIVVGLVWWIGFEGTLPRGATYTIRKTWPTGIETANISYTLSAGQLIVTGTPERVLTEGTVIPNQPVETYQERAGEASYALEADFPTFYPTTWQWKLGINRELPFSLTVENGAGELFLALENLNLVDLQVNQGVGDLVLRVPKQGSGTVTLDQGLGRVRVLVPADAAVRIMVDKGISRLELPPGYRQDGDGYISPGFGAAEHAFTLTVEQAVGAIDIRTSK